MFEETLAFVLGSRQSASSDEINRQNRLALRYLANIGIPVALANMLAQSAIDRSLVTQSLGMLAYFVLIALFDRFLLPKRSDHATLLVYLLEAPVMLMAILLGTVWDPSHQATTVLLFLVVLPVLILDKPIRVMAVTVCWAALFAVLCVATKEPNLVSVDLTHVIEFTLMSIAVSYVVLRLRNEVVKSLERTRYHLEHDTLTGTRNRRSLETNAQRYLGRELFVAGMDINHLTLFNDFHGREFADELTLALAKSMTEVFGEQNTYRYEGDVFLGLLREGSEQEVHARTDEVKARMAAFRSNAAQVDVTCSCGYVFGVPQTIDDLHGMIQLAVINNHMARGVSL